MVRVKRIRRRLKITKSLIKRSVGHATASRSCVAVLPICNGSSSCYKIRYFAGGLDIGGIANVGGFGPYNTNTFYFTGSGDFLAMYTFYRIKAVRIKFMYNQNLSSSGSNAFATPIFCIANEYADVPDVFRTVPDILQRDGCYVGLLSEDVFNWEVVPTQSIMATSITGTNGVIESKPGMWINTNAPTVKHHGTKFNVDTTQQSTGFVAGALHGTLFMNVEIIFELKNSQ